MTSTDRHTQPPRSILEEFLASVRLMAPFVQPYRLLTNEGLRQTQPPLLTVEARSISSPWL